jgi:hypothetical protein
VSGPGDHTPAGDPAPTRQGSAPGAPGPTAGTPELPFIDAYSIEAKAPPEHVWDVIVEQVLPRFGGGFGPVATGRVGRVGTRILRAPYAPPMRVGGGARGAGTDPSPSPSPSPPSVIMGFRVERAERPALIALAGEHRFARYSLTLRVAPGASGSMSRLSAETRAAFRGTAGRMYMAAVIGSGAHRLVVSRLLHRIRRISARHVPPRAADQAARAGAPAWRGSCAGARHARTDPR